jgi:glutathione synthase/RimK-type ligase-like ATP-grasp enzyme
MSRPEARVDVVILTESRYENPASVDWYIENILFEDNLLRQELAQLGLRVERVAWARPDFDWSQAKAAVFRSTWDYFHRFAEFTAWLDQVTPLLQLINPASLIRWNCDKHYLLDLEARGVHCVPGCLVEAGDQRTLAELLAELRCSEAILKPAVGGAGRHIHRVQASDLSEHGLIFRELIGAEAMLIQPFQNNVLTEGEISLVIIGGRFTHAVRKRGKPGDFRVHDDYGGTVHPHEATPEEIDFAERAVAACQPAPLYARVDLIRDNAGRLAIMELELIEPELFFRFQPTAAKLLAEKIKAAL